MASQVEIASSAPFGRVLKDHNRRDQYIRENNTRENAGTQSAFQKNLKELVRGHLHTCISVSSSSSSDENSQNYIINSNVNHQQRQHLRCLTNQQETSNVSDNNVGDSSTMSCKQARILDQWAAKQAQAMVSTIENQNQEAELLNAAQKNSSSAKENSHNSKPKNSSAASNRGASSLVQIWEARLSRPEPKMDRSNSFKNNSISAPTTSRTSSTSSYNEIVSSSVEEPPRNSDIIDSVTNEESLADWDSAAHSSRSSVNFTCSDAGESERVRIADIIKRFTSDSIDHEQGSSVGDPPSRRHSCGSDQSELRALSQIVNSPKIRGRQAFNDLLYQMEQERLRELESLAERQSVSRFPQRGRIQSMLRLRFLQRGVAIQEQQRSRSIRSTIASDGNRSQQGSIIMHLRERFSSAGDDDHATSSLSEAPPRNVKEMPNNPSNDGSPSAVNHVIKDNYDQDISITEQQAAPPADDSPSQVSEAHEEDAHEENSVRSDVTWQGASSECENFDPGEVSGSTQSLNNWDGNEMDDEEIVEQQDFGETNYDWFTDIARPRSYWEDQRQAWYQEMLTTSSDNNEIRKLLERSWNYNPQHHEVADSSEQASLPYLPSQSSTQHRQYFASPSHPSIDMELIYDIRGHMEQMQREMSELRRTMQACMEMQAKLQNSLKLEVHPVQEASKNSINMATKRRTCCICYEMQVDSFLYRCGHMCTCLKCAHELQWSSGKCPICRAPILDVVRAYMDS
ncbi:ubiquitin-protein ligase, putative [Ricinus communis]|uniref:Ubiquitin-protein ligase, putative n=1 Tax=Ricinus communis TaxID=3988 RepID=B9SVU9_RICCO|nr:ubiquitin-protein ligase, putative [Ricinus communis]